MTGPALAPIIVPAASGLFGALAGYFATFVGESRRDRKAAEREDASRRIDRTRERQDFDLANLKSASERFDALLTAAVEARNVPADRPVPVDLSVRLAELVLELGRYGAMMLRPDVRNAVISAATQLSEFARVRRNADEGDQAMEAATEALRDAQFIIGERIRSIYGEDPWPDERSDQDVTSSVSETT